MPQKLGLNRALRPTLFLIIAIAAVGASVVILGRKGLLPASISARLGLGNTSDSARTLSAPFVLSDQVQLPASHWTDEQIAEYLPAFSPVPFDKAGFNPVTMPFHYVDLTSKQDGDSAEAYSFSFLLSNDLDWSPGCYCAFHAFFTFKTDPDGTKKLAERYDSSSISSYVQQWRGTHGIGGNITKTDDGYTGELDIFSPAGELMARLRFDKPQPYFDLLGDISVAALKFFGTPPSEELTRHLHLKRCQNSQSLIVLGKAAYARRGSDQEFQSYRKVLYLDPGFTDVRYWRANQLHWAGMSEAVKTHEDAIALDSYITSENMRMFDTDMCPSDFKGRLSKWRSNAEQLWGYDSPNTVAAEIRYHRENHTLSRQLMESARQVLAQYPNQYGDLIEFARSAGDPTNTNIDTELAASVMLAATFDRFMPGSGEKNEPAYTAATDLIWMGRPDLAERVVDRPEYEKDEESIFVLLASLKQSSRYQDFLKQYQHYSGKLRRRDGLVTVMAMEAATLVGNKPVFDSICTAKRGLVNSGELRPLTTAYRNVLSARPVDINALISGYHNATGENHLAYLRLLVQLDLSDHRTRFLNDLNFAMAQVPGDRQEWILIDAYDRQTCYAQLDDFYLTLSRLYSDDPWVASAVTDRAVRRKQTVTRPSNSDKIAGGLSGFSPNAWVPTDQPISDAQANQTLIECEAWDVASVIADDMNNNRNDAARDLSLRYQNFTRQLPSPELYIWANHMVHQIALPQ